MMLGSFAQFSTFAPGIAPSVPLAVDATGLARVLAAIAGIALLAVVVLALRARTIGDTIAPPRPPRRHVPRPRGQLHTVEVPR